jgi:RNA polymerase sigma factor for flagellar operon FliA
MTSEILWTRYQKQRTHVRRNDLVEHYLGLAHLHAENVQRNNPFLRAEDLLGAASTGLINAVEAFNPARKLQFTTFSNFRIRGAIMDWLREVDSQSRSIRLFERDKNRVENILIEDFTDADVAAHMDLTLEKYHQLNEVLNRGRQVYFSSLFRSDDREPWDVEDTESSDPSYRAERASLQEFISRGLSRIDRMVLILYYFEGLTMREIGGMLNLSESRISQLQRDTLIRVRKNLIGTTFERDYSEL